MSVYYMIAFIKENGVQIDLNDGSYLFHWTVTIVSGDNPASAALGSFKQSASAFRYCRHCFGTDNDIQSKVNTFLCAWSHTGEMLFSTVSRIRLHYLFIYSTL